MARSLRNLKKPDYEKLAGLAVDDNVSDDKDYWEVDHAVTKRIKVANV